MNKEDIKQEIELIELSGFGNQGVIQILNLKVNNYRALCDIKHTSDDGTVIGRYNKCEYELRKLEVCIKKRKEDSKK